MGKAGGEGGEAGPPMSVPPAAPWRPRRRRGGRGSQLLVPWTLETSRRRDRPRSPLPPRAAPPLTQAQSWSSPAPDLPPRRRSPARSLARVHITQWQVAASPLVPPPAPPRCPRPLLCFLPAAGPAGPAASTAQSLLRCHFCWQAEVRKREWARGRGREEKGSTTPPSFGVRTRTPHTTPAPLWQACLVGWVKPQCVHTEPRGAVKRGSGLAEEDADQAPAAQGNSELPEAALRISKNRGDGRNTGKGGLFPVHTHTHTHTHTQPLAGTV
ncbi:hypothetical protein H8958_016107, partial [Nasalis larvatus]